MSFLLIFLFEWHFDSSPQLGTWNSSIFCSFVIGLRFNFLLRFRYILLHIQDNHKN